MAAIVNQNNSHFNISACLWSRWSTQWQTSFFFAHPSIIASVSTSWPSTSHEEKKSAIAFQRSFYDQWLCARCLCFEPIAIPKHLVFLFCTFFFLLFNVMLSGYRSTISVEGLFRYLVTSAERPTAALRNRNTGNPFLRWFSMRAPKSTVFSESSKFIISKTDDRTEWKLERRLNIFCSFFYARASVEFPMQTTCGQIINKDVLKWSHWTEIVLLESTRSDSSQHEISCIVNFYEIEIERFMLVPLWVTSKSVSTRAINMLLSTLMRLHWTATFNRKHAYC